MLLVSSYSLGLGSNSTSAYKFLPHYDEYMEVETQHKLPRGSWFDHVTSPHFLFEILIYLAIQVLLGLNHTGWIAVTFWVTSNQVKLLSHSMPLLGDPLRVTSALLAHEWYRERFKEVITSKKNAIFPGIL
ncbi:unnamed protein product [Darwinula stevensoni]|uniref:Polyprenal reductase n=1 Tax=Darwinula stevensoni TaxID=69355 RepID=A0A7R9A6F5_9CRUS|nr:unnamed protein product [Darwinula stevensoni]CAG0889017.1 unnamed protein product [Darwinula stevensoni]